MDLALDSDYWNPVLYLGQSYRNLDPLSFSQNNRVVMPGMWHNHFIYVFGKV